MKEKTYTLTEEELIENLALMYSLGKENAFFWITQRIREDNLPALEDLDLCFAICESVSNHFVNARTGLSLDEGIYERMRDLVGKATVLNGVSIVCRKETNE